VTIAADGRHSTLAFALGLARHPAAPRRWAIGAYYENVDVDRQGSLVGEMHLRRGRYVGIAPIPGGLTNVCLVKPSAAGDAEFHNPVSALDATLGGDALLAGRFRRARMVDPPTLLGPLAVETTGGSFDGLIVTGDASGFIDPMTGDGLRFAIRGGELAATAALSILERGWSGAHAAHDHARRREFASKRRFNRSLRALVSSPAAMAAAGWSARIAPGAVRAIIARAGDCDHAG
jgi:flavin-dependent dehydrogenase